MCITMQSMEEITGVKSSLAGMYGGFLYTHPSEQIPEDLFRFKEKLDCTK